MRFLKNYSLLIPVLVLVVMALSMGLMISELGFYMDDWPKIFFQEIKGPEATHLFQAYDGRPLQGGYQVFLFNLFGTNALLWQIYSLALRYVTVIFTWLIFRKIWPNAELQIGLAAILFSVYPIFAQQQLAISFMVHWTSLLCFVVSAYLMLWVIDHPKLSIPITLTAMIISGLGLVNIEYFIGLEFLRLLLLWWVFSRQLPSRAARVKKTLLHFSPYFLVAILFVLWRTFLIELPVADRNDITLVGEFINSPIKTAINQVFTIAQDLITLLLASWYKTYQPDILNIGGPIDILSIGITILISLVVFFASYKSIDPQEEKSNADSSAKWEQILTGSAFMLLGAIPGWLIGRNVGDTTGIWNDRFGMASMAGAALVVVILLERMLCNRKTWLVVIALLVGLAGGWQIRNANDFRWSWIFQKRFYNQLVWRIPGLKPDTLFLSEFEFFPKMGVYPTSFAINTLYPQNSDVEEVNYWFLTIPKYFGADMASFIEGTPVDTGHWQARFSGHTRSSIVVLYPINEPHCLWVLGPEDALNPEISEITKTSLQVSDLSRISTDTGFGQLNGIINIPEKSDTWCYYYQKADLAQQFKDWQVIESLWVESQQVTDPMNSGVELVPFIDGFVHLGKYQQAVEITERAMQYGNNMYPYLCNIWETGIVGKELSLADIYLLKSLSSELECDWKY